MSIAFIIGVGSVALRAGAAVPPATSPPGVDETAPVTQPQMKQKPRDRSLDVPDTRFTFYANTVSAILWGQTLNIEFGKRWSGSFRFRSLNASFLSQNAFVSSDQRFSPGFGLAGRYYFRRLKENLRGIYLELSLEYHLFRGSETSYDWASHCLVPVFETGYRWILKHLVVGIGVGAGYGFEVGYRADYWFGYNTSENRSGQELGGLVVNGNVEVGYAF